MEELEKLQLELSLILNELYKIRIQINKQKGYIYYEKLEELYTRKLNILNKINQIRLKYWYWK